MAGIASAVARAILLTITAAASGACAAQPSPKVFKDWVVGCDNIRGCVALGLTAPDAEGDAYLKITQGGAAQDEPLVTFSVYAEADASDAKPKWSLRLALDGEKTTPRTLSAEQNGDFIVAALPADAGRDFLSALRDAKTLTVEAMADGKAKARTMISLAGSSAALRFIDAQQMRADTQTALVAKGDKPAVAAPPPPALPMVDAKVMHALDDPIPPLPAGIPHPPKDCSSLPAPAPIIAFRLSPSQTLFGVCDNFGAYNWTYRFFIAGAGKPAPARFETPGEARRTQALVSPYLSEDGKTLIALRKDIGAGGCGDQSVFAFDGERFVLVQFSANPVCRGVLTEDWPVLYRAGVGK